MKISILRTDLANAVMNVSRVVSTKASIPALEGILIKAYNQTLTISGYDLEIGMTTTIDATIQKEGEIVVSAKIFGDIVRKLPEEIVCIETDDRMITYITSGTAEYQIIGMSSAEYPDLPSFEEYQSITVKSSILKEMIRKTVYAVSDNMIKPVYTGSLFEIKDKVFKIVSIDGYRMAIRQEKIEEEVNTEFIVPGKTQLEILKLMNDEESDINISVGTRHISFNINNYSVISRLIEGTFIEYNTAIPKEIKTEVIINTRKIIEAVDRMALLNTDKLKAPLRCLFSKDEIKMSCSSSIGKANDIISAPIIGEDVEIGFNNKYLLDAFKNIDADEVKLTLNGAVAPMVIKPVKGDNFLSIVVPMRISK